MSTILNHARPSSIVRLLLLFLSFWAGIASAVVTIDNVSTVVDNNPTSLTASHTTSGADRFMIVGVSMLNEDLETVTLVTYNGAALSLVGSVARSTESRVEIWSYINPPVTTANVVVNFNEEVEEGAGAAVITFNGVDQSDALGSFQFQDGSSITPSIDVSSASGELVLGVLAADDQDDTPTITAGTQQWSYKTQTGNNRTAGAGATSSGSASTTLTWGMNETDDWAVGAISIRPSVVPGSLMELEAGQVALPNTALSSTFTAVSFAENFTTIPLVFTLPTNDGGDPTALRIRNVSTSGFEIAYVEPNAEDGTHPGGTVDWLAINSGDHTLADGTRLLAGSTNTSRYQSKNIGGNDWEPISFAPSFGATPAVIAMVQTMNSESATPPGTSSIPWLVTGMAGVNSSSMNLALERAESNAGTVSSSETIAYLAMDAGQQGILSGSVTYETILTADNISGEGGCANSTFQNVYDDPPLVFATQNKRDGGDGGWVRRCNLNNTQVGLVVDEDQDQDSERSHTTERAGILVISNRQVVVEVPLELEAGQVVLPNTATSSTFTTVSFTENFTTIPLVFALPTNDGGDPAALRIVNVGTSSFEIAYVEPNSEDGTHPGGTVDWLAINSGYHTLADGTSLLAGSVSTSRYQSKNIGGNNWEPINFVPSFGATPAVIAMVQTMNSESASPPGTSSIPWLVTAMAGVNSSSMNLALERAESNAGSVSSSETIAYLAVDAGQQGILSGSITYETILTADNIVGIGSCANSTFQNVYVDPPLVFATQNKRDGGDGGWVRRCNLENTQVGLVIDEDQDQNSERTHTTESAGILVISSATAPTPIMEYRFDESGWNGTPNEVVDSSGNMNNGIAVGGITTVAGKICNAAEIPSNNSASIFQAVDTGVDLDTVIGSSGTISLWYKGDNAWNSGSDKRLFDATDGSKYFTGEIGSDGRVKFWFEDGSDGDYQKTTVSAFTVAAGVWKHLTFVWDVTSSTASIFVDGVEQSVSGASGGTTAFNGFDTLYFGDNRDASYFTGQSSAGGLIDEALVFDSVLTPTHIQTIFSNQDAGNNYDGSLRSCPTPLTDHYVISQTGNGISCEPYGVSISAVDGAGADVDIPAGTTLTLSTDIANNGWSNPGGTGPTYTVLIDSPSVDFQLRQLTPATLEIDVDDNLGTTDDDGNRDDDIVVFSDAGFVFYASGVSGDIGTQISDKSSNIAPGLQALTLKAVRSNPSDPGVCEALISNTSADIGIAYQCVDPSSCATSNDALTINSTTVDAGTISPYTAVTLLFDSAGESTFTFSYADAGLIALSANADLTVLGSSGTGTANVQGDSNNFVVKPAGLCVQVTAANSDCASGDAGCSRYIAAGIDFNLEISGRAWVNSTEQNTDFCDNALTPNYIHSGIGLNSNLVAPGSGVNAALSVTATTTDASGTVTQPLSVNEVGVFTFTATAPTYFTEAIAASTSINVGRFIPDYFELTGGSITAANSNTANFTYLGQPFLLDYSLTAKSALSPATNTANYESTFAKLNLDSVSNELVDVGLATADKDVAYGVVDTTTSTTYNGRLTATGPGVTTAWIGGVINVLDLPLTINRGVSGESSVDSINVGVLIEDSDGVKFQLLDLDSNAAGGAAVDTLTLAVLPGNLLYGRVFIPPVHGPEISLGDNLDIPFFVQYFDGGNFTTHFNDSSTDYSSWLGSCADADLSDDLICSEAPIVIPLANAVGGKGDTTAPITIARPGLNNSGSLNITVTVDDWLKFDWDTGSAGDEHPASLVTFGRYRGHDRIIYWRETQSP
ncbi:MAG: hypothetical protein ACJA0N_000127 [Pseudohongiellaceae bacterium]|jgi:hypothetical protein